MSFCKLILFDPFRITTTTKIDLDMFGIGNYSAEVRFPQEAMRPFAQYAT